MEQIKPNKKVFESESSIFVHPVQHPKVGQALFPTWALMLILIIAFFLLKSFIYISDKKRHGK